MGDIMLVSLGVCSPCTWGCAVRGFIVLLWLRNSTKVARGHEEVVEVAASPKNTTKSGQEVESFSKNQLKFFAVLKRREGRANRSQPSCVTASVQQDQRQSTSL